LNEVAASILAPNYSEAAVDNFIYFWFPNQFPVFAMGSVVFFLIRLLDRPERAGTRAWLVRNSAGLVVLAAAAEVGLAHTRLPHWLTLTPPFIPVFILASLVFAGFVFALSFSRRGLFVNRPVQWMGKVSFSAYLLHYVVITLLTSWLSRALMLNATGYLAIVAFVLLWVVAVLTTFLASYVTYRVIELPMIGYGHAIARRITMARASASPRRAAG
jgi:peptidoglycan/LPS O-acetylase OafA/YrhL